MTGLSVVKINDILKKQGFSRYFVDAVMPQEKDICEVTLDLEGKKNIICIQKVEENSLVVTSTETYNISMLDMVIDAIVDAIC